uniref:Si:dkey-4p15.5 n=1 Tax=Hippocampus comes TaxID=109280 RepID=A0A3Q2YIX0_HIPCM
MWLALLVCQLSLLGARGQIPAECVTSDTNRPPGTVCLHGCILCSHFLLCGEEVQALHAFVSENSDIMVYCGTEHMDLSVFLCPVYQALYNESLMVLNNELNNAECFGEADFTVDPPVLKFSFPINESTTSSCGNDFNVGSFADFSNVQYVNISGTVNSIDPSASMITYRPQLIYMFSCLYPMQYIINNTELASSARRSIPKRSYHANNGTPTEDQNLRRRPSHQFNRQVPVIFSKLSCRHERQLKRQLLSDLFDRFNVLLDRCYATTSPYPAFDSFYDLFIGCTRDDQTEVILNGESQVAHFSFEAFRFVEHKNRTVSTFYLHCVTRLCEVSACEALKPFSVTYTFYGLFYLVLIFTSKVFLVSSSKIMVFQFGLCLCTCS